VLDKSNQTAKYSSATYIANHGIPVWIDAEVMARPRIILGGGSRSWKVISTPALLSALPGALVVEGLANPVEPPAG